MLDLEIFRNRLFAAASGAAFINGLSRFALLFVFVFYFQGAQGDDPITAGIKLAPMALGMLVASPSPAPGPTGTARARCRRSGCSSAPAALAAMTTLEVHTPYWQSTLWLALVGIGSGMFNSPNTAAMMGAVPAYRRGVAAGARMMLQNTGAVLSIAFVMAIITAAVPKDLLLRDLLRRHHRALRRAPRAVHPQHAHRVVGAGRDVAGRRVRLAPAAGHVADRGGTGDRLNRVRSGQVNSAFITRRSAATALHDAGVGGCRDR